VDLDGADRNPERNDLLDELLSALGGAARIASVRTYAREASLVWTPGRLPLERPLDTTGLSPSLAFMAGSGGREAREQVLRVAGGRARLAIVAVREKDGRPESETWMGDPVLTEARREPRVLLAHARERGAQTRAAHDGGIEVLVTAESLLYRFDPGTLLCAGRTHTTSGASSLYLDWRPVSGILTPWLEIETHSLGRLERRVLGVAYDLPWPERLFRPSSG